MNDQTTYNNDSREHRISSARHVYEIKVEGHLDSNWPDWFDGWDMKHEDDSTLLIGTVIDQSDLYGHLDQLRDLNLTLILVRRIEPEMAHVKRHK